MSHFKHGANVPDTTDADFRIILRTTNSSTQRITRVPDRPPLTYAVRMLTAAPILLSMGGGALNIWSGKAAMLGSMAGLLLLVALNVWVDPSRARPFFGILAGIALAAFLIATAGVSP